MISDMEFEYEPWMVYMERTVKYALLDQPKAFRSSLVRHNELLRTTTGYNWANKHYKFRTIKHGLYTFSFHISEKDVSFHVWDSFQRHVGEAECSLEELGGTKWENAIHALFDRVFGWDRDELICSDCNTTMKAEGIAGRYFAGIYCEKCWEETWKAIEAKETYN